MKNELRLPAEYAVMTEDEMTYTEGGSAAFDTFKVAATVVGSVVLGASYIWGISTARNWLSNKSNRKGNVLTVLGRAMDDIGEDMTKSPSNFLRDSVSTAMVVGLAPISLILVLLYGAGTPRPLVPHSIYLETCGAVCTAWDRLLSKECYYGKQNDDARLLQCHD